MKYISYLVMNISQPFYNLQNDTNMFMEVESQLLPTPPDF